MIEQIDISQRFYEGSVLTVKQQTQNNLEYAREVLKHITNIGSSLRIQMDTQALLDVYQLRSVRPWVSAILPCIS